MARHVADVDIGLYVSPAYAAEHGVPDGAELLAPGMGGHTLVGSDQDPAFRSALRAYGLNQENVAIRSDNLPFQIECVRRGLGVGAVHTRIAADMGLLRVSDIAFPTLPLWVVTHVELRASIAVRAVFSGLCEALAAYYAPAPAST